MNMAFLNDDHPADGLDNVMRDIAGSSYEDSAGHGVPDSLDPNMLDLDHDATLDLDTTEAVESTNLAASDRIRELLGDDSGQAETDTGPPQIDSVHIKEESPQLDLTGRRSVLGETIVISDDEDEDIPIKRENEDEESFVWASMPDDVISISDSDNGSVIEIGEKGSNSLPQPGHSFLGLRPRRDPQAIKKIQEVQQAYLDGLRKHRLEELAKGPRGPQYGEDPDDNAWMSSDVNFDEDAAAQFKELQRNYKLKDRSGTNTIEDDYEFQRAVKAEKTRRKRLRQEYLAAYGDDIDDDHEDRPSLDDNHEYGRNDDDGGNNDSDSEGLFVKQPRAKRAGSKAKDSARAAPKRRKLNSSRIHSLADIEKDVESNMLAGIEGYLRTHSKERETKKSKDKKSGKPAQKASGNGRIKSDGRKTWTKKDKAPQKKRPTQIGYLNNAASLLTSNVFADADANRGLAALPALTGKTKKEAFASLIASVPIGDKALQRQAQAERAHIRRATVTLGKCKVNPAGPDKKGDWKFTGMDSALYHHQVQGAAWMKERELGDSQPLGGILADGMGLGKTLMAVALIVANPPTRNDQHKATLIVCTPALLGQWEKEIAKHTTQKQFRRIMRHYSGHRQGGLGAIDDMEKADIVLTTYTEVMKSYPKAKIPDDLDNYEKLRAWWHAVWQEDRDILHKAHFYRVILDESQAIKNHLVHTSIACRALMAKHRWCLSGTPIMNRVEELYPYFKFLRVECTGSFADFTRHFCIEGSTDCNKRLHCILDQIMIRRTMHDKVLDHPIVTLPETHQMTERLDFNIVERLIYGIVSRRFIRAINKASSKGELEKKASYGFVLFLRLRQLAAHPFLIQEILQEMFKLDSIDRLEKAAITGVSEENKSARDTIAALRRMVEAKGVPEPHETTRDRGSLDRESEQPEVSEKSRELIDKFAQRLRSLKEKGKFEELRHEQLCHKCGGVPEDPVVTSCFHVYCKECLGFLAYEAAKDDLDSTPCRECRTRFTMSQSCSGLKELLIDDFSDLCADIKVKKPKNGKVNMHWVAYDDNLVLSAKTLGVEAQIEKWLADEPDKKIIVFSQFLMIMVILERVCQKNGWGYCTYNGKMSHQARDKVIESFGNPDSNIRVMIASLKCGGIGLNLTMASKVICVDLWFNSCMEQQAFCRVFRIGQEHETFIMRLVVNNTVDDRLDQMQKYKEKIVGAAIDDRSVLSKLSVQEVMRLFGEVHIDKRTKKPLIALDEDELLDEILPPVPDDEDDSITWRR